MNIEEQKIMQQAQKAGQFTDFAFLCKGTKIPVHKVTVCAQSKAFNAACNSDFKRIPVESVEMMVDYFYVGYYGNPNPDASKISLSTHLWMLVLADKYLIQRLESQAKSFYISRLKQKKVEMEDFLRSLPLLYELPVAISRDAIDAAVAHTREAVLTCICRKASMGVIDQISDASQDFLKEVMMSIMTTPLESRCSDCSKLDHLSKSSQELQRSHASRTRILNAGNAFPPGPRTNVFSSDSFFAYGPGTSHAHPSRAFAPTYDVAPFARWGQVLV
ncbi:hypothetical protein F25303_5848 [Fusarium sp. NRRL 25303]|nr:hypothetical protein F25303_5848 [Fusarium sp. NRRL 25303]